MTIAKYLTGGAWAAMAAALCLAAVPASAAPENSGRSWDRGSSARSEARADRLEDRRPREATRPTPRRDQSRAAPPVRQAEPAPATQPGGNRADGGRRDGQRDWNRSGAGGNAGGRDWNRSGNDGNRGGRDGARQGDTTNRGDGRANDGQRGGDGNRGSGTGWNRGGTNGGAVASTDRNRSYTDRDRNRSYDGRRDNDRNSRDGRRDNDRNWGDGRRDTDRNWDGRNGSYRDGDRDARRDHRRWDNRGWRNDRRYDWNRYRSANRDVFRLGVYYSPYRNYHYRRLSIGFFLDSLFYSNRYWINDPWRYRLPEVYGPYRWVRYYDDALLVDVYSGEVVDVIHDFFW
jgi:hypothetical protein